MFNFLKKSENKQDEEATQDIVPVDNLKHYVVKGYETEKKLKATIDRQERSIQCLKADLEEFYALKIILEKKELDLKNLSIQLDQVNSFKDKNIELKNKINDFEIYKRNIEEEKKLAEKESLEKTIIALDSYAKRVKDEYFSLIDGHRGNLSKDAAKKLASAAFNNVQKVD